MPSSFKEFLASRDAPAPAPAPAPTRKKKQAAPPPPPPAPPVRLPLGFGKQTIAGVEVWYVRPERCTGLLFVAHGMCHGAYDWFRGDEVAGGVGLPEEVAIVRAASARGYAVAAVSSLDRSRKAWSPEADGPRVAAALEALAAALGGRGTLRVAAFGASNGGAFVLHLTRFVALDAVCCAIMALAPRELEFLAANPPVWKSTTGLGRPDQTLKFSSSAKSKSIRLIFGRIDRSRRVLEAEPKSLRRNFQIRSH